MEGNATSNATLGPAPTLTQGQAARAAVLGALALLSLAGNAATIASIRRGRRRHVEALLLHLSVADVLVSIFCIAGDAFWSYTVAWKAGNVACKLFKFAQMFSLYLSTFVLVLIGVERYVVVRYPMRSLGASRVLPRVVTGIWILSAILSIPQVVIFHVERGPFREEFYQCVTFGFYTADWQEQLYAVFSLVCMFLLPLTILVTTYVSTILTIARSEQAFRAEAEAGAKNDVNRRRLIHRAKIKSLRISVVIVAAFVVWWTPYYILMIISIFHDPDDVLGQDLRSGIFFFGMSNSLVNPIIYGAFHLRRKSRSLVRTSTRNCSTLQHRSTISRQPTRARSVHDEETSLVFIDDVHSNGRRLSSRLLQHLRSSSIRTKIQADRAPS